MKTPHNFQEKPTGSVHLEAQADLVNRVNSSERQETVEQLDHFYGLVKRQLLSHQSPTSHLFPATSEPSNLAHIRDSVYCSVAVWSLCQAYRRLDDDRGKSHELGQSVVACMRGILTAWMKQAEKLERWKQQHSLELALHTVVGLHDGEEVLDCSQYNHLQLDVVCLYLLYLVQMITSGLEIVYSVEEVAMIQNLVYYIERAYRYCPVLDILHTDNQNAGDGYCTELEDADRRFYQQGETLEFEKIENEWPIFYLFMIIDGVFKDLPAQVAEYQDLMCSLVVREPGGGDTLVPMMYQVGRAELGQEREQPRSQRRRITQASLATTGHHQHTTFLWGQALHIIAELLTNRLVLLSELDRVERPLLAAYRVFCAGGTAPTDLNRIQVVMIAESTRLQCMLANYGIQTQTPTEVEPVQVWPPSQLVSVFQSMGNCDKLGLKGRPGRPVGSLGTSKLYRVSGKTVLCYPLLFSASDFYLSHDMALLTQDIRDELKFIGKSWRLNGRPTFCIVLTERDMRNPQFSELLAFLAELRRGEVEGVKVRLGRLQNLLSSACVEHLDFLPDQVVVGAAGKAERVEELRHPAPLTSYHSLTDLPVSGEAADCGPGLRSEVAGAGSGELADQLTGGGAGLKASVQLCGILLAREGPGYMVGGTTVRARLEQLHREAGQARAWAVIRYSSSLLGQGVDSLSPALTQILCQGHTVTVGTEDCWQEFEKPCSPQDILAALYSTAGTAGGCGAVLQQELILYSGKMIACRPELFTGLLVLRMPWVLRAIEMFRQFTAGEAELQADPIESLAPSAVRQVLQRLLEATGTPSLHPGLLTNRQLNSLTGCLLRLPSNLLPSVFFILERCPGGLTFSGRHLPRLPTVRTTDANELSFHHLIFAFLAEYREPDQRFLVVRVTSILATVLQRNPELTYGKELVMDELVQDSVLLFMKDRGGVEQQQPAGCRAELEVEAFLSQEQSQLDSYIGRAIVNLLLGAEIGERGLECKLQ